MAPCHDRLVFPHGRAWYSHAVEVGLKRTPDPTRSERGLVAGLTYPTVEHAETVAIRSALTAFAGNLSQTARGLGIDRNTLKRKMKKYSV